MSHSLLAEEGERPPPDPCRLYFVRRDYYYGQDVGSLAAPLPDLDSQEHYWHMRIAGKRVALDSISTPLPDGPVGGKVSGFGRDVHQNDNQTKEPQNIVLAKLLN